MTARRISSTRTRRRPAGFSGFDFSYDMIKAPPGPLGDFRKKAWEIFESLPYPTTQDEAWRRTDIRNLDGTVKLPEIEAYLDLPPVPDKLLSPLTDANPGGQIIMLPGGLQLDLDPELSNQGIIFTDLVTASSKHPDLLNLVLGQIVKPEDGKFAALTGAMAQNGVFVYVPKGVRVEQPLHSLVWGAGVGLAHFSHLVIYLDSDSSLTYVHESASPENGKSIHASNVEIYVGSGATLQFVELQSLGKQVWNFTHERAQVHQDGKLDWIFGAVGSRVSKNFSDLDLVGPGAVGKMSGFFFTDENQHLDHDTQQNHFSHHTTSDLLFKGALKGSSRSVWQGMIYVAPDAQQTDGYQANRNLILSSDARADSIPGLEILADDVRCTHGATVGKMDPDLIFYLSSRGISKEDVERLIVEGFFEPIMQRIPFDKVQERFKTAIEAKMNQ
jgi:Fe-S cluster assembly protein SufD